jgi:protoheme IX farnesyltransferase
MLPVTHGEHYTKVHILLYTLMMFAVTCCYAIHEWSALFSLRGGLGWTLPAGPWFCTVAANPMRRSTRSNTASWYLFALSPCWSITVSDHGRATALGSAALKSASEAACG